ncbi:hypothetical protein [Sphingobium sp. Sx8-8]|uniref:hypothetical protein n=1 Tax=Sphingobium sp. Sx8-8 TaxID=2933617 RepID=UPI001F5A819B|nr:hypothetical protein [Sphingobium sp. Sx8-8]
MTQTVSRVRRQRRASFGQQIHIPHSSWTRTGPETAVPVRGHELAPDEFWSRLGL